MEQKIELGSNESEREEDRRHFEVKASNVVKAIISFKMAV